METTIGATILNAERNLVQTLVDVCVAVKFDKDVIRSHLVAEFFKHAIQEGADAINTACDDLAEAVAALEEDEQNSYNGLSDACRAIAAGDKAWQRKLLDEVIWHAFGRPPRYSED